MTENNHQNTSRRQILKFSAVGSVATLVGCLDSSDDDNSTETPDVDSPEPDTYERGDNLSDDARRQEISVDTTPFEDPSVGFGQYLTHATAYSYETIDVKLDPRSLEVGGLEEDTDYVVEALAFEYLTDNVVGSGESESFSPESVTGQTEITVEIDFYEEVLDKRLTYSLFFRNEILPSFRTVDRVIPASILMATNPFEVTEDGIEPSPSENEQYTDTINYSDLTTEDNHPSTGSYTRYNVEGGYHVFFSPETPAWVPDISTEVPFYIPKLIYDRWKEGDRPERPEPPSERTAYVTESFESGVADHVANVVGMSAMVNGAFDDKEKINFMSAFVQSLPYALDSVSTGYRDYSRYPAETLVDARGDCVDTSILLASALMGSSVDCEVGFFSFDSNATEGPAGHLAVAVSLSNISFDAPSYQDGMEEYYYIEPTGFFSPGEIPSSIIFDEGEFHSIEQSVPE